MSPKTAKKRRTIASIFARVKATVSAAGAGTFSKLMKFHKDLMVNTHRDDEALGRLADAVEWHVLRYETLDGLIHWRHVVKDPSYQVGGIVRLGMACTRSASGAMTLTIARAMPDTTTVTCLACIARGPVF